MFFLKPTWATVCLFHECYKFGLYQSSADGYQCQSLLCERKQVEEWMKAMLQSSDIRFAEEN